LCNGRRFCDRTERSATGCIIRKTTAGKPAQCYRLQVISTANREEAFKIKAEVQAKFPDQKTYIIFESPSFRVRIGNFLKREEAQKFKIELNKLYLQGGYIVEDGIEYTLKEDEDIINQ
jgi:hypothetical protein